MAIECKITIQAEVKWWFKFYIKFLQWQLNKLESFCIKGIKTKII